MRRVGGEGMTCLETQSLITPFINNQLDMTKLEPFLAHIKTCKTCKEELQVYYALLTAIAQLDEDQELTENFNEELENKIADNIRMIKRKKNARIRRRFYLIAISLTFVILSSISVGKVIIPVIQSPKPSFEFKYNGIPDFMNPLTSFVEEYDGEARTYTENCRRNRLILYQLGKESYWDRMMFENNIKKETKNE